ncbi:hypothetical protein [Burkholderia multivorans]|uniref:hypothetical protein n=1 Tax=Burkholderia multivorans TaxID=87883 RepID=UPI0021C096B4|nr:hypothetical protein [Burkholderia multivorans]
MPDSTPRYIGKALAAHAAERLGARSVVLLTQDENGVVTLYSHGATTHAEINGMLSVGIHINLSDHDAQVLGGAAGQEAMRTAQSILNS